MLGPRPGRRRRSAASVDVDMLADNPDEKDKNQVDERQVPGHDRSIVVGAVSCGKR